MTLYQRVPKVTLYQRVPCQNVVRIDDNLRSCKFFCQRFFSFFNMSLSICPPFRITTHPLNYIVGELSDFEYLKVCKILCLVWDLMIYLIINICLYNLKLSSARFQEYISYFWGALFKHYLCTMRSMFWEITTIGLICGDQCKIIFKTIFDLKPVFYKSQCTYQNFHFEVLYFEMLF